MAMLLLQYYLGHRYKVPAHEWPLVSLGNIEDLVEPLAIVYSCYDSPSNSYSAEDVKDGENISPENVSKWVASKRKSIAGCIGVAFSGYELEIIQLLSRNKKKHCSSQA